MGYAKEKILDCLKRAREMEEAMDTLLIDLCSQALDDGAIPTVLNDRFLTVLDKIKTDTQRHYSEIAILEGKIKDWPQ